MLDSLRTPTPAKDPDGTLVLLVPLANNRGTARITPSDFTAVSQKANTGNWYLSFPNGRDRSPLVRCHRYGSRHVIVARLIVGAKKDETVAYRDGDALNLRRDNLVRVVRRGGPRRPVAC